MITKWRARSGIDTGGGNGIYWVRIVESLPDGNLLIENLPETGRKQIPIVQSVVERELVYPLLRGKDVDRWKAGPSKYIIVPHNATTGMQAISEKRMRTNYPKTCDYFLRMKACIQSRRTLKIFGGSTEYWYSLFKIGKYTFARYKVVWKEIAKDFAASVVSTVTDRFLGEKAVLPDHKLMLAACKNKDEALYLCAILNSCPARTLVKSYAVETQMSTHVFKYLKIPAFDKQNPTHRALILLSNKANELAIAKDTKKLEQFENKIDETVAFELYGLSKKELSSLTESLNILLG